MSLAPTRDGRNGWNGARGASALDGMFPSDAELSEPAPLVSNIALAVVEIVAGLRGPEQVQRWVDPATMRRLDALHRRTNRRNARGAGAQRAAFAVLSSRVSSTRGGIVEGSAVVTDHHRARAVAMRLEAIDNRWFVTELQVL